MHIHKFIYWIRQQSESNWLAQVHVLDNRRTGYRHVKPTMAEFNILINMLRETFPDAKEETIFPSRTKFPSRVAAKAAPHELIFGTCDIIVWMASMSRGDYPGWIQVEGEPEYDR